jgi:hypothetical protein
VRLFFCLRAGTSDPPGEAREERVIARGTLRAETRRAWKPQQRSAADSGTSSYGPPRLPSVITNPSLDTVLLASDVVFVVGPRILAESTKGSAGRDRRGAARGMPASTSTMRDSRRGRRRERKRKQSRASGTVVSSTASPHSDVRVGPTGQGTTRAPADRGRTHPAAEALGKTRQG